MTSQLRAVLLGLGVLAGASAIARAQEPPPAPRAAEALRVFLDCRTTYCDFDYVRTEVNFVNYVRDPVDAQIFVLVTTESTGGGGTQFTVNLIGEQDFTGRNDTLFYVSQRTDTYDEVRRGLTQTLKLGLVRYAARSVLAEQIQITYAASPGEPDGSRQRRDPWNYWAAGLRTSVSASTYYNQSIDVLGLLHPRPALPARGGSDDGGSAVEPAPAGDVLQLLQRDRRQLHLRLDLQQRGEPALPVAHGRGGTASVTPAGS